MAMKFGSNVIPDDHVVLIGRVAEAWSQLEFHIDQGIWSLIHAEQQLLACITSQFMSIHPRMKAFTALCTLHGVSEKTIKRLNAFSGSLGSLADKRNRCVHDPRYKQQSSGTIHRLEITARPKVQFGFIEEQKTELTNTIKEIERKVVEFIDLHKLVIAEIRELPPESRPQLIEIRPVNEAPRHPTSGPKE